MSADAANSSINLTSEVNRLKHVYYPMIIPPLLCLCLLTIFANGVILVSVRWLHRTPSPLLRFTISLCVADFWLALQMSVNFVIEGYLPHVLNIKLNQLSPCQGLMMEAVRCGALITSVLHLLALASNHYVGIVRPLHYNATMTPELTYAIICVIWFLPTVGLVVFFGLKSNNGFVSNSCSHSDFYFDFSFRVVIGSLFIIPLFIMFFIYAHIAVLLIRRRHNPHLSAHVPANQLRRNLKAATTTTLYLGTFTVCWMPSVIMSILICKHGCPIHLPSFAMENPAMLLVMGCITQLSIVVKGLCDAAIYAARVREIQFAMWSMHRRLCCGPWTLCKSFDKAQYRSSIYQGPSSIGHSRNVIERDRARSWAPTPSRNSVYSRRTSTPTPRTRYGSLPVTDLVYRKTSCETDTTVIECQPIWARRPHDQHLNEYRKVSIRIPSIVNEETLRELDNEKSSISSSDHRHDLLTAGADSPTGNGTADMTVVSGFALPLINNAVNV